MSAIKLSDVVDQSVLNWPKEYLAELEKIIQKSAELGKGSAKQGADELSRVQAQLSKATERSTHEYIKQKAELDKLNKSNRDAVKEVAAQGSAYDKLSNQLNKSRAAYKDLAAQGKGNTREAKALREETRKLDAQLKKIDNSVGQNQRSVGKYSDALKGLASRLVSFVAVIGLAFKALQSGIKILLDYTKANSTLNAILGKTSKETESLRKQQQALGKATAFSASQVTKAQTELARLGLSIAEITDLTPAILNAAVALGVDMAQAAELVAGQLNAFGLAADEGARVADVLTKATQISAFNFERLQTALAIVSPAAKASNATIEDTVGILTAAVDANIDASTAATSLRNIYIDLADKGLTWQDAMNKINGAQNKLTAANELFGKRGAVVATVIASNTEKINENTIALRNAAGAADAFAKEQLDNLSGDLTLLTSAWEGFILSLEEGDGFIARTLRKTVQLLTIDLQRLSDWAEGITPRFRRWRDSVQEMNLTSSQLENQITMLNAAIEKQNEVIDRSKVENIPTEYLRAKKNLEGYNQQLAFLNQLLEETRIKESQVKTEIKETTAAIKEQEVALADLGKLNPFEDTRSEFLKNAQANKESVDRIRRQEEKLADDIAIINERKAENDKKAEEKRTETAKEAQEQRTEIVTSALGASAEIFSMFSDLRIQQISDELNALEFARERDLEAAGESEAAKFEINKQFDQKRKELQRKQANAQKANALFTSIINTASSIIATGAQLGYPAALPFIAIAAAIGAAQQAIILAQKPPKFDKGTGSTPKDYIAGEKRPEFRISKGKVSLVKEPTLFTNSPGDKIISGKETDSILGTISDITGKNILNDNISILGLLNNDFRQEKPKEDLAYILRSNNEKLITAIKNKREAYISVTNSKTEVKEKHGNQIVNRLDKYYRR